MHIAVLGTGTVGRTLAARFAELGHEVRMGTRDPEATRARDADGSFAGWAGEHAAIRLETFAEAAAGADLVVNATNGAATLEVLALTGSEALDGTVLLDISNPLDFSQGFPPSLLVKDTDSLGEQVQAAYPGARVVKALNTLTAELMARPATLPEGTTVFVAGEDAVAKERVTDLLHELGHTDVLDLGGIEAARGTEMYLPLWLRMMRTLGTAAFNIRVVR
jgi:predicted dinucleotide-binding enzyme